MKQLLLSLFLLFIGIQLKAEELPTIRVGSKAFTESYVLGEIIAQKIENSGLARVERRLGLGGTGILFNATVAGEIDLYPDYTGTLTHAVLNRPELKDLESIQDAAKTMGVRVSGSLGFNNSYGIAVTKETAEKYNLRSIGDLIKIKNPKLSFTHEFLEREDGYRALARYYNIDSLPSGSIEHALSYSALESGSIDVTDIYTTDAKIDRFGFFILEDDKNFFPVYEGVLVGNEAFVEKHPEIWKLLRELEGSLSAQTMIALNARAEIDQARFEVVAAEFLEVEPAASSTYWTELIPLTGEHFVLVFISLIFSIIVGIPLGLLAAYVRVMGQAVLTISGLIQTIPSLALLAFLIPFFGIGLKPSLIALFLYGLLPIVRGTYSGIMGLDRKLMEVGRALGLSPMERLRLVELPLASIHILSGIKTSAIINVGTATLAALIGAGGYGSLILTGLSLNNNSIILKGAIPAAVMALCVHAGFELLDRLLIPKGLQKSKT